MTADTALAVVLAHLAQKGISAVVHAQDFERLHELLRAAPDKPALNPVFNPRLNSSLHRSSLWMQLIDPGSRTLGVMASRLYETDSYLALKRSGRLWADARWCSETAVTDFAFPPKVPDLKGKIVHEGALWIAPKARGGDLVRLLTLAVRLASVQRFDADWYVALLAGRQRNPESSFFARRPYYYEAVHPCFEGSLGSGEPKQYFIAYASRSKTEMLVHRCADKKLPIKI